MSLRKEIAADLGRSREETRRLEADLYEVDSVLAERNGYEMPALFTSTDRPAPALKNAIVSVLAENPTQIWDREELYAEIDRRGWGPGGAKPRNTITSRLRDLELEGRLRRVGRDMFTSIQNEEEVPAV